MSPRKFFDRFMADNENGRNLKLMRLSDAEYRAFFAGVLPIASKADIRGSFMVGKAPATAEDICNQSPKTTAKAARTTLEKLRAMGMLEFDDELGGEWVHDFDELNPSPKSDPSNAQRQAAWRARNAARNGSVTDGVTPKVTGSNAPEVEGEVEVTTKRAGLASVSNGSAKSETGEVGRAA